MDLDAWLRGLGLEQYGPHFRKHDVGFGLLVRLTADDLKEIGVAAVGHRRRMLDAIQMLRTGTAPSGNPKANERSLDPKAPRHPPSAGRRQLTVMFVDLVSSTELSQRLDPEEMSDLIHAYQDLITDEVARFGGYVSKYLGDGVLAYFGWPVAQEDAAERAVRAGLAIAAAMPLLNLATAASARIGIATGQVVVGELIGSKESRERSVVGETPNLAARLQGLAKPGEVIIADGTRTLLGDLFLYRDLGRRRLKGFGALIQAWCVLRDAEVGDRFRARHTAALTPMIGRSQEMNLLRDRWRLALAGKGQVVLIRGEPGIGKSRIAWAISEEVRGSGQILRYQCSPFHVNAALWPVVEQLQRAAGFARHDDARVRLGKLEAMLGADAGRDECTLPLLAELLGIDPDRRCSLEDLSPHERKARTFRALIAEFERLAAGQGLLVIVEDAHWMDPTTHELLDLAIEQLQDLPVLIVVTCRPGFEPRWSSLGHVGLLTLASLDDQHAAAMAESVARQTDLPRELLSQIVARTDGVPLFVEELTKTLVESRQLARDLPPPGQPADLPVIPATLQDSLLARLDRLVHVRGVVQVCAVIGREFSLDLLAEVAGWPTRMLKRALADLLQAELIFVRGPAAQRCYAFKHALVQDVAYRTLLRSRRRELHAKVARTIEERFPDVVAVQPELLAHHFTQAELIEQAVAYWQKAGTLAIARSAGREAIAHLSQALALLDRMPEDRGRMRRELDLQIALGSVVASLRGYGSLDAERVWKSARALCESLGEPDQLPLVLLAQCGVKAIRADYQAAKREGAALLALGERRGDVVAQSLGHRVIGVNSFHMGDLARARHHLGAVLALDDPGLSAPFGFYCDTRVVALCYLALVLTIGGRPGRARQHAREALSRATFLRHPASGAYARAYCFMVAELCGDTATALAEAEAYLDLAEKLDFLMFAGEAKVFHGWAMARTGQPEAGLARISEGFTALLGTRTRIFMPYNRCLLIDALLWAGRAKPELLLQVTKALRQAQRIREGWFEAELVRRRGELLALEPAADPAAAKQELERAWSIAAAQDAPLWRLRTAISMARAATAAGEGELAHQRLAAACASFAGDPELPHFREAQELLRRGGPVLRPD